MLTHIGTTTLETERLILRQFKHWDTEDMLKYWISDPEIQNTYCEPVYETHDAVMSLLNTYISSYDKKDFYRWGIIHRETNQCIGQIAYYLINTEYHFGEIEYCIGSLFQKQGFATEATKAVIDFGFNHINLHKVQISHKSNNAPSRKVIEKCGFTYDGTLRDFFYIDGQYIDRLYYSILKHEYFNK